MFPLRMNMAAGRNSEWRCCFCLHVRTATILLGIWHLILHILALSVLAIIMRNHQQMILQQQAAESMEPNNFLPTPLSKVKDDNPYYLPTTQDGRTPFTSDMDMGALMTICTLAITLLLVYGTIKGKATHLLPFFCLQLFDFAITTLTATSYFCYLRSVHSLVADHWHNLPFKEELLQMRPQYLSLIVLLAFLISMLWKAYCIGIVWRCYKFLTLRKQAMRSTVHYILPTEAGKRVTEPDYSSLLPDYEAACASAMKQPPPSYAAAMASQPPQYATPPISMPGSSAMTPSGIYPAVAAGRGDTIRTTAAIENEPNGTVTIAIAAGAQDAAAAVSVETPVAGTSGTNVKPDEIVEDQPAASTRPVGTN